MWGLPYSKEPLDSEQFSTLRQDAKDFPRQADLGVFLAVLFWAGWHLALSPGSSWTKYQN